MKEMSGLLQDRPHRFLISSDSVLDPEIFEDLPVAFSTGHYGQDVLALTRCDILVGPPSTLTIWASFFGQVPLRIVTHAADKIASLDEALISPRMRSDEVQDLYWIS
jgi:hypothetical protein